MVEIVTMDDIKRNILADVVATLGPLLDGKQRDHFDTLLQS